VAGASHVGAPFFLVWEPQLMAGRRRTSIELVKLEAGEANEMSPADLIRLLQLRRDLQEPRATRPPKETIIRWIEPGDEQ